MNYGWLGCGVVGIGLVGFCCVVCVVSIVRFLVSRV